MEIKNYSVIVKGNNYSQGISDNVSRIYLESIPAVFTNGFFLDDTAETTSLMERKVLFDLKDGRPVFTELPPATLWAFNKVTKLLDAPAEDSRLEIVDGKVVFHSDKRTSEGEMARACGSFFFEVMRTFNPYFAAKLFALKNGINGWNAKMCANLYPLLDDEMANVADKVFSAMGDNYFLSQLNTEDGLVVQTGVKKIQQVIGLPNKILEFVKRYPSHNDLTAYFKVICEDDPNDGIMLIDYLDTLAELKTFKKTTEQHEILTCISLMQEIKKLCKDIRLPKLLRYVIKQRYFYGEMQFPQRYNTRTNMTELFLPPNSQLREYRDYLKMMPVGGDLYPRNLTAAHNICVRNAKIVDNPELAAKFEAKVKELEDLDYETKDYIITHPHTIKELVYEGNTLEHCVATYASTIASGLTRVMFVRKADEPDVPFVTVEIDDDFNLVQVKEKYDIDVTDPDVMAFLKKWAKKKGE